MKKLLLAAALSAAVVAPSAASAQDPAPSDFKNAAKYCKEFRDGAGDANFVSMFGTKKNAYGKCVSQTAKKNAAEDDAQAKAGQGQRRQGVPAEGLKGREYGKCVSTKAKAKKAAADKEDEAQEDDRINAAKSCKAAKKADADHVRRRLRHQEERLRQVRLQDRQGERRRAQGREAAPAA